MKTAGTSVEMALEPFCAAPGHRVVEATPAIISEYGVIGARRGPANLDKTGWASHLSAWDTRKLAGPKVWNNYERIAVIRNPFDKAVSWFFWANRFKPVSDADRVSAFRAFLKDKHDKGYFKSAADVDFKACHIRGLPVIHRYLKMEELRSEVDELAAGWGMAPGAIKLPATKTNVRAKDKLPVAAYFDQASIDILRRGQDWIFRAGRYAHTPHVVERASARLVA
ncbi:hypothetical protein [Shimia ponticola]|uniref:hypothetical protein n=1 Tax=Shimia ponticola TaxID=2582893 RepID=UPI0011BED34F|nr:hypothetical protein [Shimia ponticola]